MDTIVALYAVRNNENKWFRAGGRDGYRKTWVDNLEDAKIYGKLGQARSRVTYYYNNYPNFPAPNIIQLSIKEFIVIDEIERLQKVKKNKELQKQKRTEYQTKRDLEIAQRKFDEAKIELDKIQGKTI